MTVQEFKPWKADIFLKEGWFQFRHPDPIIFFLEDKYPSDQPHIVYRLVWTTLIIGYFTIDYQLVRVQLRTKLRTVQIIGNQR
jgi:hypothetical protein